MSRSTPRVSILIPNFNNGRASSCDGRVDLIGDLLRSLHETLAEDPTPLEIIAYDDGSSDDSLTTLREWSRRTWRGGQPFLTLIEAEHCGVLARTSNVLARQASGEILVRLDGDTQMLTPRWAALLCEVFDHAPPRLGVVGPKQLRPDGRIHAFGDWVLHPKGYHHIAAGLPRDAARQPIECDHVMGCFYCCRRAVFDDLNGFDEDLLRGQTIDFGLRARLKGWSCIAIPQIEYVHRHGLRGARATEADTAEGVRYTLDTFQRKWGFDRLSPDLDAVRERYAGTPLLWNARVFALPVSRDADASDRDAVRIEDSDWQRYARDESVRQAIDFRAALTTEVVRQAKLNGPTVILGGGSGLLAHVLAKRGLPCISVDRSAANTALAEQCVARQQYPGDAPRIVRQAHARRVPLPSQQADLVLLIDQLERHDNPIALLREAYRLTRPGGWITIVAAWPRVEHLFGITDQHRYLPHELTAQLRASGAWQVANQPTAEAMDQPQIVIAQRVVAAESAETANAPARPSSGRAARAA